MRARVTSVLEPVGSQPVRITVRFEGMGQDLVEQTFEWPVRERVRRFSDDSSAPRTNLDVCFSPFIFLISMHSCFDATPRGIF